jgi:hypothetical protein
VQLTWQTAGETNGSYFSLERASDSASFRQLTRLPAAGGPSDGHQYQYTDASPLSGKNFYRLKMVAPDGTIAYSGIATVIFGDNNGLVLFPNPSDGRSVTLRVHLPAGVVYTVSVYNGLGMLVQQTRSSAPILPLSFSPVLLPGLYVVRVTAAGYTASGAFLVKR